MSAPVSCCHASTTGAKASLTSNRSMSLSCNPAFFRTFCVAGMGPVSMMVGSEPTIACATMRALVDGKLITGAVLLDLEREDLAGEPAFPDRLAGFDVALVGELIQLFAAEAPLLGDHLGRIALRDDLEQIHQLGADRAFARAEGIRAHRHPRHVFHAGPDDDVLGAREDPLGGKVHRLLAGATESVDGRSGDVDWEARDQSGSARDIHALLARLGDAAGDDVVDLRRVHAGTGDQLPERERQQIVRPNGAQLAAAPADRRADGFNDDGFSHSEVLLGAPTPLISLNVNIV